MSESNTWSWLRDRLPVGHASRIETEVSDGFPDVHYTMRIHPIPLSRPFPPSRSLTLELKFARGPKKCPFKDQVRDSQIRWISDELDVGGIVWLVCEMAGAIYFLEGIYANQLNRMGPLSIMRAAKLCLPRRGSDLIGAREVIYKLFTSRK